MNYLNTNARSILRILVKTKKAYTKNQLGLATGLSWNAINKYINKLETLGFVKQLKKNNRIYWKIKERAE